MACNLSSTESGMVARRGRDVCSSRLQLLSRGQTTTRCRDESLSAKRDATSRSTSVDVAICRRGHRDRTRLTGDDDVRVRLSRPGRRLGGACGGGGGGRAAP